MLEFEWTWQTVGTIVFYAFILCASVYIFIQMNRASDRRVLEHEEYMRPILRRRQMWLDLESTGKDRDFWKKDANPNF